MSLRRIVKQSSISLFVIGAYFDSLKLEPVWPEKNRQMSIKLAQKMISLEKW